MVRPSRIARKAQRAHERQQENLRKQNLRACIGCDLCSATKARDARKALGDSYMNRGSPARNQLQGVREPTLDVAAQKTLCSKQQERTPSLRSKIRQGLKNKLFRGIIIIDPGHVALTLAAKEVSLYANQSPLVYWTDCSRIKNSCCGIGVAYQSSTGTWTDLSWRIRGFVRTHVLEVHAIAKALEVAWQHCHDVEAEQRPSNIVIYSDCSGALEFFARFQLSLSELKRLTHGEELVGPGIIASEGLSSLEIEVELRYVPGHARITGNLKADRAARHGAKHSVGKQELASAIYKEELSNIIMLDRLVQSGLDRGVPREALQAAAEGLPEDGTG